MEYPQFDAAKALGSKLLNDPWFSREQEAVKKALEFGGVDRARAAAREIIHDDHFKTNWWPQLVKIAGNEAEAHACLRPLLDGYIMAMDSVMEPDYTATH